MTEQPEPTDRDHQNAVARAAIAERQNLAYDQVLAWADRIMSPGWYPTRRHYLVDKADEDRCRHTGERPVPAATVFTVKKDGEARHFTVEDGQVIPHETWEAGFGDRLHALDLSARLGEGQFFTCLS